jgi:hypothetical protein
VIDGQSTEEIREEISEESREDIKPAEDCEEAGRGSGY